MEKQTFKELIQNFGFAELFNQLGWDNDSGSFKITVNDEEFRVSAISEKSGFKVLVCNPGKTKPLPTRNILKKIQAQVKKRYFEHLLIFFDEKREKQVWQYTYRPVGKPVKTVVTEYNLNQDPQLLYQRASGLVFQLDEEGNITLPDVTKRVSTAFDQNAEKVTKKFYDGFKKQHAKFMEKTLGIPEESQRQWYTSVMLNRLMFCYFIQKQGFLDGNLNYLRDKLRESRDKKGKDQFYSFYRNFLLLLFHNGLGSPDRDKLREDFGHIPYLNGGIFSVHDVEQKYGPDIDISDDAFEALFTFFEDYNWHLDTRPDASGKDINPDVIGYIFEKYINDRANMGAYYTKEDITDYIGKNTIIPWLFDETQRKYHEPFGPNSEAWIKLKYSGDRYIYPAVKHGIDSKNPWGDIPDDVKAGLDPDQDNLVELRRCWNRPAPEEVALPTEIWREVITRRQRYLDVTELIGKGKLTNINDLITYNLDMRQFAHDLLEETNDPKLVFQFYQSLKKITILDPTCGSGAFLFAAMNILEDLYEVCIQWMSDYVEGNPKLNTRHMKEELAKVEHPSHPNLQYFIFKSIILNNLYGVDIMYEAVEIAKLRLFLKLVACVDKDEKHENLGLEPLPDIDFNIRCGNSLVGYSSELDLDNDFTQDSISFGFKPVITDMCEKVALASLRYKEMQLDGCCDYDDYLEAKSALNDHLVELTHMLDIVLHQRTSSMLFDKWKSTHKPFHWFGEYYEIIHDNNGFDVIIGNPPYVEIRNSIDYSIIGLDTVKCGNLYAPILERCLDLVSGGKIGVIIPLASFSTKRMNLLQDAFFSRSSQLWLSHYEATSNPSILFVGVKIQLSIMIASTHVNDRTSLYVTKYRRAFSNERPYLFDQNTYSTSIEIDKKYPRVESDIDINIANKIFKKKPSIFNHIVSNSIYVLHYRNMGNFFYKLAFLNEPPYMRNGLPVHSSTVSQLSFNTERNMNICAAVVNSTTFYMFWTWFSDCYHLSKSDITSFPINVEDVDDNMYQKLHKPLVKYLEALESNAIWQTEFLKNGDTKKYRRYYPQNCKFLSDEIDIALGNYYRLSPSEIDYILHYDYKYRMGSSYES